jgi:glycosyltransferase involved in cell wall biosynthesis
MQINTLGVAAVLFGIGFGAEFLIHATKLGWRYKKWLAAISLIISGFSTGIFLAAAFSAGTVLLALLMVYRAINLLRIIEDRMHEQYLRRVTTRSFMWLGGAQILTIVLWDLVKLFPAIVSGKAALLGVSISLAVASLLIFVNAVRTIISTKVQTVPPLSDKELPTVTVAVAARNENDILRQCLESALASDYPKLEIIVLDDCSQDHTADIIKSFAHDGVRFVQGIEPTETWLAKNAAYQKLLEEASGELIVYMGVDVRLHEKSLRRLVEVFVAKNITMLSVLPKRTHSGLLAAFIQPMRYWWELALPRWVIKHQPVLSTSWVANRQALIKAGGFKSVTRAIVPEEILSTKFSQSNKYAFVRTNEDLDITTHKDFRSQWLTAVRTRYPEAHRRPEYAALRVLIMLFFLVAPFVLLPLLLFATDIAWPVIALTAASVLLLIGSSLAVALVTNPIAAWLAPFNFPIVVLIDFIALHISMYRYEFGEVIWKGRNVTTPAMHVYPHLPELE